MRKEEAAIERGIAIAPHHRDPLGRYDVVRVFKRDGVWIRSQRFSGPFLIETALEYLVNISLKRNLRIIELRSDTGFQSNFEPSNK